MSIGEQCSRKAKAIVNVRETRAGYQVRPALFSVPSIEADTLGEGIEG